MGSIQLLPDEVVNKIAAGEIIERPVSIVKETVENSLDAGATEIRVEIEGGGKQLIRITDNGSGIPGNEAQLAFERHATSKIRTAEDLHQVATMGFRGEALASIASVCQVVLKTRRESEEAGTSLFLINGKLQNKQPVAIPTGTILEARGLFFNTPARKKFLKSDQAEAGAIVHFMNATALAHPEIAFSLYQDGRTVLDCPKTSNLKERIFQIYGSELLETLLEIDETLYHFRLYGYVSRTDALKTNRNYQYFFINRRMVKDKVLSNAVYVAYRFFAESGQYPVAFLFLEMPAVMVDVNVHPAKYEVRFLQQSLVQKGVIDAISKVLTGSRPLPQFQVGSVPIVPRYSGPDLKLSGEEIGRQPFSQHLPLSTQMPVSSALPTSPPARTLPEEGQYKIIGQYDNTYILLSDDAGLIIVDQHVAHERILYEQLLERQEKRQVITQSLLIPLVIEVNPAQMMLLEDHLTQFRDLGFEIEVFGNNTISVREIPELLIDSNYSAALSRLLEELEKLYRGGLLANLVDEMRKSVACQASVKINMPLTREKMEYMISELLKTKTPQVCPHGRPIILRISHYEIEKNFRRI